VFVHVCMYVCISMNVICVYVMSYMSCKCLYEYSVNVFTYGAMYVCKMARSDRFFKTENIMMYECITQRYFLCLQIRIAFDKVFHLHLPS